MEKVLLIGCGSIGRRHAKVFNKLGINNITAVDLNEDRLLQIKQEAEIARAYIDIDDALNEQFDFAIISTPPHIHTNLAIKCADNRINLFIEKPLTYLNNDLDILFEKIKQNNIKAYVAYCYRYIPSVNKLKKIINNKEIGKILSYRLIISSYLPDWHPWEDYRSYYMAKKEQGGGAIYDESHGIDLVRWLFDDIKTVYAEVGNISELEISADDVSILITNHYNGIKGSLHFDLLGRTPRIGMEIIGSGGTILWDRINPSIKIYKAETKKWDEEIFNTDDTIISYDLQAKAFLNYIRNDIEMKNTLEDAFKTFEIIENSIKSSDTGEKQFINLN